MIGEFPMPTTMTEIGILLPAARRVWSLKNGRCPEPKPEEVLVEVAATGVDLPDILQRLGCHTPPPATSDIAGLEIAGTVAALGSGVSRWHVGDLVCALVPGGRYAGCCTAHESNALPVPVGPDNVSASVVPSLWSARMRSIGPRLGLVRRSRCVVRRPGSGRQRSCWPIPSVRPSSLRSQPRRNAVRRDGSASTWP